MLLAPLPAEWAEEAKFSRTQMGRMKRAGGEGIVRQGRILLLGVQRSLLTSHSVCWPPQRLILQPYRELPGDYYGCIISAASYLLGQRIHHNKLNPNRALLSSSGLWPTDSEISSSSLKFNMSAKDIILEGAASCASEPPADIFSLGCIFFYMTALHAAIPLRSLPALRTTRGFLSLANIELLIKCLVHLKNFSVDRQDTTSAFARLSRCLI